MAKPTLLVSGGAGYIGTHVVFALIEAGYRPVVLDDLSTGRRDLLPDGVPLVVGDCGDMELARGVIREHGCRGALHFAGSIIVPESVDKPLEYYANNTSNARNLIEACVAEGLGAFVFSSTAAVYGNPSRLPLDEDAELAPINPYGRSKLMVEWILEDTALATDLRYVALRYFNVAGADPDMRSGQISPVATHLLKIAAQTALGLRENMQVFGEDYDTPDGTCIRDYIHVTDLASAHVAAMDYLLGGGGSAALNCGYGHGFSVREMLDRVEAATGEPLNAQSGPRRAGDAMELVSDSRRIRETLGWTPRYDDLDIIVKTALDWERKLQD